MLKYLITIFGIILFSTVFIVENDIPSGTIESKNYGFLLIAIPAVISLLFISLFTDNLKIQIHYLDIFLVIFLAWVFINSLLIKQISPSIGFYTFAYSITLSLLFKQFLKNNPNYLFIFCGAFLFIGGLQAILGLSQLYGFQKSFHQIFKVTGTMHNPGPFGIYVAAVLCFAFGNYIFNTNKIIKNLAGIVGLVCFLILPSTQSRSAWVAVLMGVIYLIFAKYGSEYIKKYFTNKYINLFLIIVLFGLGILGYFFKANSALGRLLSWRVGIEMVKQKPVTGIGYGEFHYQYGFYQADFFKNNPNETTFINLADRNEYAFNDYLQILIENGFIGFSLFIIIVSIILLSKPTGVVRDYFYPSKALIIVILCASCFSYPFELISHWWVLVFFIGLVSSALDNNYEYSLQSKPVKLSGMIVSGILSIFLIRHTIVEYKAKQIWYQADTSMKAQDFNNAITLYKDVLIRMPKENAVLLGYGKALYMNGQIKESLSILEKASQKIADPFLMRNLGEAYQAVHNYNMAEKAYVQSSYMIPNVMLPKYLLAKMYLQKQDTIKAKQIAKQIIKMPVKITSRATVQMKNEMENLLK